MTWLVHEQLFDAAGRFPGKRAIICDQRPVTYAAMASAVRRLAMILRDGGLRPGDRVTILVGDKYDLLVSWYAVMTAGGIAVPLHQGCSQETISEIVGDCEPGFIIAGETDLESLGELQHGFGIPFVLLRKGRAGDVSYIVSDERIAAASDNEEFPRIKPDDGAAILYTSGTTGRKKGVFLTHRNLVQSTININTFMGVDNSLVEFVSVPFTHSFGFGRARCIFQVGGTVVCTNSILTPVTMSRAILENNCNGFSAVPTGVAMFLGRFDHLLLRMGPLIRFVELGSSPMDLDHKLRLLDALPHAKICMHYGLTEASRSTFLEFTRDRRSLETVGRPAPNVEIAILDPLGVPQMANDLGEIAVRGGHVAKEYWRNPALTRERLSRDGWLRTGDHGFLDLNGHLHLVGRNDEMINMGGIKIAPQEIEDPIRNLYPSVDLCVVGCPDPKGIAGEVPVLCYVPRDQKIREAELADRLWSHLDRFKIPRFTIPFDELPRTENQKLRRQEVKKIVSEHIAEIVGGKRNRT